MIVATCTMPNQIPNASARIADMVGIKGAGAFDLNAACAGFCYAIGTASDLVRGGSAGKVLVIGAEKFIDWVEPTDRANAIIFADGAGAVVVGGVRRAGHRPGGLGQRGDLADLIYMRDDKLDLTRRASPSSAGRPAQVAPIALRALELAGLKPSDVDVLIPHQANLRIVGAIAKKLRRRAHARTWWSQTTSCTPATPPRHPSRWRWTTCARRAGYTVVMYYCSSASVPGCPTPPRS